MKLLKTLFLITATFIFSGCYFLDYVIPEEYFAVEETVEEDYSKIYTEYIWIIHSNNYNSLNNVVSSLESLGIIVYDIRKLGIAYKYEFKNKSNRKVAYSAKIKSADLHKLLNTNWHYWYNA